MLPVPCPCRWFLSKTVILQLPYSWSFLHSIGWYPSISFVRYLVFQRQICPSWSGLWRTELYGRALDDFHSCLRSSGRREYPCWQYWHPADDRTTARLFVNTSGMRTQAEAQTCEGGLWILPRWSTHLEVEKVEPVLVSRRRSGWLELADFRHWLMSCHRLPIVW